MMCYQVASFYEFLALPETELSSLRAALLEICQTKSILGTIILANEGVNGTIAGCPEGIQEIITYIRTTISSKKLELKSAPSDFIPFQKLKILIKNEIVTLGVLDVDPEQKTGIHLAAEEWNQLIRDPEVVVLDTRNTYEIEFGTFKGAINPNTESFGDFPAYVQKNLNPNQHKKIAMFCTGGIRCEKASSYLLDLGFNEVYQLEGGILKYLSHVKPEESLWEGQCFVFDERVSVPSP